MINRIADDATIAELTRFLDEYCAKNGIQPEKQERENLAGPNPLQSRLGGQLVKAWVGGASTSARPRRYANINYERGLDGRKGKLLEW